jgi:hypothetical protein
MIDPSRYFLEPVSTSRQTGHVRQEPKISKQRYSSSVLEGGCQFIRLQQKPRKETELE